MSWDAIVLVLLSVSMHATWNFLSKKSRPSAAFFCIASFIAALCWCWVLPVYGIAERAVTPHALVLWGTSLAFETLYFIGLFKAYSSADMSLAYPVARALPVLLIAGVTAIIYPGRYPNAWGMAALFIVFCGCLMMPLPRFSEFSLKNYTKKSMRYILLAAIGTTGYTLTDSELVKMCVASNGYNSAVASYALNFVINFGLGITLGLIVLFKKSEQENFKYLISSVRNFTYPAMAGVFSSFTYALVLVAMTKVTHLSFLLAFRQMSLPIGLLLGILLLKEPAYRPKIAGIILLVTGLVMIAFLG